MEIWKFGVREIYLAFLLDNEFGSILELPLYEF